MNDFCHTESKYQFNRNNQLTPKRFAFTLAEVLITLGIIGVVAALTMPSMMAAKERKELKSAFMTSYSLLQQAKLRMDSDFGDVVKPDTFPSSLEPMFKKYYIKYFKVLKDCGYGREQEACVVNSAFGENVSGKYLYHTFNNKSEIDYNVFDDGQFIIQNGALVMINGMGGGDLLFISVDVNGINKKPNRLGYDLFVFQIIPNGKFLPAGADETAYKDKNAYCSKTSVSVANGMSCAYNALTDKDYFKNLP